MRIIKNKEVIIEKASSSNQIIQPESNLLFIPQQIDDNVNLGYSPKLVKELGEKLSNLKLNSGLKINTINPNSDSSSEDEE